MPAWLRGRVVDGLQRLAVDLRRGVQPVQLVVSEALAERGAAARVPGAAVDVADRVIADAVALDRLYVTLANTRSRRIPLRREASLLHPSPSLLPQGQQLPQTLAQQMAPAPQAASVCHQ